MISDNVTLIIYTDIIDLSVDIIDTPPEFYSDQYRGMELFLANPIEYQLENMSQLVVTGIHQYSGLN